MGPEHMWWWGGWFFPIAMPLLMLIVLFMALRLVCGRGDLRPPWGERHATPDTALDILNKRYARGELTKEEFTDIKRDLTA